MRVAETGPEEEIMTEFIDIFAFGLTTTVYLSVSTAMVAAYALALLVGGLLPIEQELGLARAG